MTRSSTSANESPLQGSRAEPNLDILRAVAVLMVLGDHVSEMIALQTPALSIHPYNLIIGRLGVLLFFVHTALVLNHSMARMQLGSWEQIRSFYVRRAARIYPLAIACVAIVVAFEVPHLPWKEFEATWATVLTSVTLTTNLAYHPPVLVPLWSLPIEVQMYIALPIIYLIVRQRPLWVLALWCASLPIAWLQPVYLGRMSVLAFAPCFLSGVLAYTLSKQSAIKLPASAWPPVLSLISVAYVCTQGPNANMHYPPVQWGLCLLVGAVIPMFADSTARALNTAAAFIAKYSYGIYLSHCIAIWLGCVVLSHLPTWQQWTVAALTLCVLTGAGYHLIEEPGIKLGAKFARGRPAVLQSATVALNGIKQ
jgi:peptidoglycan/LPS O-acetylase OafA/YrhL